MNPKSQWMRTIFVDATYEGDLYAAAGAEYSLGAERQGMN